MFTSPADGDQGTTGLRVRERLRRAGGHHASLSPGGKAQGPRRPRRHGPPADATILCLPDAASRELVAALGESEGVILDASTAHRTDPRFTYGFPELGAAQAQAVRSARRIAVPGCHASGCIALVKLLVDAGLLARRAAVALRSRAIPGRQAHDRRLRGAGPACCPHAPSALRRGPKSRHLPEITYVRPARPSVFQPVVMDVFSGMLVSLPLTEGILSRKASIAEVSDSYRAFFQGRSWCACWSGQPRSRFHYRTARGPQRQRPVVSCLSPQRQPHMTAYARFDTGARALAERHRISTRSLARFALTGWH